MAGVAGTIVNDTGDTLTLDASATTVSEGTWTTPPPTTCDKQASFAAQPTTTSNGSRGTAKYNGPNGSLTVSFNNPTMGANDFSAVGTGSYDANYNGTVGSDATVTYSVQKKRTGTGDQDGLPSAIDNQPPEDHTHQSHVPLRSSSPVVLSPKLWLVDIAWQVVNQLEWDPTILEITENRHGEASGANCPGQLVQIEGVAAGTPPHTKCTIKHAEVRAAYDAQEAKYAAEKKRLKEEEGQDEQTAAKEARAKYKVIPSDFHSWCGDFITWVFWKAWMLKKHDADTKDLLKKFINREAILGKWMSGENLSYFEKYAKKNELLKYHLFDAKAPAAYVPQPGDVVMVNRDNGDHISMLAFWNPKAIEGSEHHTFITLDGKSMDEGNEYDWGPDPNNPGKDFIDKDPGWGVTGDPKKIEDKQPRQSPSTAKVHGVAQTERQTDKTVVVGGKTMTWVRAFVDTSKIRELLGYR